MKSHTIASQLWLQKLVILSALVANASIAQERSKWTNLLKSIDPRRHAVEGSWRSTKDSLSTNAVAGARIAIPMRPSEEYDFRVTFTRSSGSNSVALFFVAGGRQASFDIDGWGQHLAGFQQIDGRDMRKYRDQVASVTLRNGQAYTAVVQVRKNEIRAYLDDKLLHAHRTDGSDLAMLDLWKMSDSESLGLGAWDSATTFHSIEVRSVSGTPSPSKNSPSENEKGSSDDIAKLSDEFNDPQTLEDWLRVFQVEKTNADQLHRFDIGQTQKGAMTLVPHTSTWYRDYRGVLVHKRVNGDFVVTTHVRTSGRSGRGAPRSQFSLAGIMIRTPRKVTPQTWRPGGENYIFISHGSARQAGTYQMEVKTTVNSDSKLEISDTQHAETEIRIARLGEYFVLLRREPRGRWTIHRRYHRPDMPDELQVGMTVYTDYGNASRLDPARQNRTVIRSGNPDLIASFNYFRFQRPQVPPSLRGRPFSDSSKVSDAQLLQFLGESVSTSRPRSSDQGSVTPSKATNTKVVTSASGNPSKPQERQPTPTVAASKPVEQEPATWQPDKVGYVGIVSPFLKLHCLKCHGSEMQEGDFRVDQHLPNDFLLPSAVEKWREVLSMLDAGAMPPEDQPRPPAADLSRVIDWIREQQLRGEQARGQTRIVLRRLNRQEYNNTIRDLMGLDIQPAADFPEDPPAAGFDNVGIALTISPLHLELYLNAAQEIVDRAIATTPKPPQPIRWRFQPEEGNYGLDRHRVMVDGQRIIVNAGNNKIRNGMVVMRFDDWDRWCGFRAFSVPHAGNYVVRVRAAGIVPEEQAARKAGVEYQFVRQQEREAKLSNAQERQRSRQSFERYVLPDARQHFADDRSYRYGPPRMKIGGTLGGRIRVLAELDVDAPLGNAKTYDVRAWFEPTPAGVNVRNIYNLPKHQHNWMQRHDEFPRPELAVDWLEIEGPIHDQWPPKSHQAIFIKSPNRGRDEVAYAREILARFMRHAFRRPLRDGELESKLVLFQKVRPHKSSFEEAIKTPLIATLCSPHFLYLVEEHRPLTKGELASFRVFRDQNNREIEARILATQGNRVAVERKDGKRFTIQVSIFSDADQQFVRAWQPPSAKESSRPLNGFELAARLSYFLWSSMPDDELSRLAEAGKLSDPRVLAGQVDRMLAASKADAFVKNFAGQWLQLRDVGANPPVEKIFPRYDNHLEVSIRRESEEFFAHILRNDLGVENFIRSNFVTINERLARFYNVPGVKGDHFRVVNVSKNVPRGGLLTQASILSVTSNGTRSSPVWRGVWILENLLGNPPPPPPPNAGDIPPGVPGIDKATVRERLRIHREQPQCARCHDRIDPLGFALENFSAAGEWRDREASYNRPEPRDDDPQIDASAQLPDGTKFVGVAGLQEQLLRRNDQFKKCLAEKMFTYALGRELGFTDRALTEAAVSHMNRNDSTLRSLIQFIVASEPYLTK